MPDDTPRDTAYCASENTSKDPVFVTRSKRSNLSEPKVPTDLGRSFGDPAKSMDSVREEPLTASRENRYNVKMKPELRG